jgi:D-lyxose ketol-isomerase
LQRSSLNLWIEQAKGLSSSYHRALPEWASWKIKDYQNNQEVAAFVRARQMGWDITDFGSGDFENQGLTLFCLRNGIQGNPHERPYAEKMLIVGEMQETPFHYHKIKLEDIINCGGGNLMIEFLNTEDGLSPTSDPINVIADGQRMTLNPREPLRLRAGQSVTVERGVYHRFYAEAGTGPSLAWEVSQVNDDFTDNYFLSAGTRFSAIDEDVPIKHPLWHEVPLTTAGNS